MEEAEHASLFLDDGLLLQEKTGDGIVFDLVSAQEKYDDRQKQQREENDQEGVHGAFITGRMSCW
jgi:hypothetical protein